MTIYIFVYFFSQSYLESESLSIVSEPLKGPISRSTSSVAPAGAASGVVDVAPVTDETPPSPQTSTKTGVVQPKNTGDQSGEGKKTPSATPTTKQTGGGSGAGVARDVDSSTVAADQTKEAVDEDPLGWTEDNGPRDWKDFEPLEDDSTKDSLAVHPANEKRLLLGRILQRGSGVSREAESDGRVTTPFCSDGKRNADVPAGQGNGADKSDKKSPSITLTLPTDVMEEALVD